MLELEGISKRFGGVTALDGVSLAVAAGEVVGLIGPNGAGKTTLFHVVSGFLRPDRGGVRFRGRDLVRLPPHTICRLGLARTFQIVQPFTQLSVVDNVAVGYLFGRHGGRAGIRETRDAAQRLLDLLDLRAVAYQPAGTLNLAERKRLELARALATGPRLLCLDEVMSGLMPAELDRMAEVVLRLCAELDLTLLMVEHNVRLVTRICRRVVVLNFGQVIADGTPEAVMANQQVIAAYLGDRHARNAAGA